MFCVSFWILRVWNLIDTSHALCFQMFSCSTWLMTPQPGVNYDIICGIQALGAFVCVVLAVLQFIFQLDLVKGWSIIFAPFIPTLVWTYHVRKRWKLEQSTKDKKV